MALGSIDLGSISTGLGYNCFSDALLDSNADIFERSVVGDELRPCKRKWVDDDSNVTTPVATPAAHCVIGLPVEASPVEASLVEASPAWISELDHAELPSFDGAFSVPSELEAGSEQVDCFIDQLYTPPKPAAKRRRTRRAPASPAKALLPFAYDAGTCNVFGPAPGERSPLQKHGVEPVDEHGYQLLITHPVRKKVMYNHGAGVDQCTVDGVTGPPTVPGVEERLELECVGRNASLPGEHPKVAVGDRFSTAAIRRTPLPLGDVKAAEKPAMGLNFWWINGKIHFVYGEAPKNTPGKMPKGIARAAVWQLRYSQVKRDSAGRVVDTVLSQKIPGLLVLRAESRAKKAKNKLNNDTMKPLKRNVIELLKMHGYTRKLRLKQGMGELLALATQVGVCMAALMDATQMKRHEIEKEVARRR